MERFENKVVLVVGSTSGIGKATVERFLKEGANVAFTDITEIGFEQEKAYNAEGYSSFYIKANATVEEDVKRSVSETVKKYGRIDIAINNVGGTMKSDTHGLEFHESTLEGWNDTKALSELSTYLYMREEIAVMLKQGQGTICNTASMVGIKPSFSSGASPSYSSSKSSVIFMTKYAAVQYADRNIRINAIAPGGVDTDTLRRALTTEQLEELELNIHPNKRFVQPGQIAGAFAYLCSDEALPITGVILPVDGGMSAT